jgi:hypothetical protein
MKKKVYVVFHALEDQWYHATVKKMRKSTITHCSIMIEFENSSLIYYHVGPYLGCRPAKAERYLKRVVPFSTFYIGETSTPIREIRSFTEQYPKFAPWKLIVWELFKIRLWKPKSCGHFTSNFLRLTGFGGTIHVAPDALFKELKNAHHYVEREGESWQDLVGKGDC